LIAFAGVAYTACPLTADHTWLKENLKRIDFGLIEDGTAIGSALSSALLRLKQSKAKSKIVILLTDGINNSGKVMPLDAAQAAKVMGVRVYTIGAGTKGFAPYPVTDLFGNRVYQQVQIDVDEDTLREIARITGGQFYRATDTESLRRIYQEIDKLEKTKFEETGYRQYKELFVYLLLAALVVLLGEFILVHLILQRLP
jgi:Ca-activated chloride channel homolog